MTRDGGYGSLRTAVLTVLTVLIVLTALLWLCFALLCAPTLSPMATVSAVSLAMIASQALFTFLFFTPQKLSLLIADRSPTPKHLPTAAHSLTTARSTKGSLTAPTPTASDRSAFNGFAFKLTKYPLIIERDLYLGVFSLNAVKARSVPHSEPALCPTHRYAFTRFTAPLVISYAMNR